MRLQARLDARERLRESEKTLSQNLYERGVDDTGFGRIRSRGDAALFGGHTTRSRENGNARNVQLIIESHAFVKWALNNRSNSRHMDAVPLQHHVTRGFESFPVNADLQHFDESDRKFVAVAGAHPARPPILQAADSKWLDWSPALQRHGIPVDFLCQSDIARFHKNKFGA